jgi:hypothetical protein
MVLVPFLVNGNKLSVNVKKLKKKRLIISPLLEYLLQKQL